MKLASILFTYDRTKYLKKCLNSINFPIDFIFIDWSKKQTKIRKMIQDKYPGKAKVINERFEHFGLAKNIIYGINEVFSYGYDAVIVIEDDLILHPQFYNFMKIFLSCQKAEGWGSVSGCFHEEDNYKRFLSWGWGTWRDRWERVDWNYESEIDKNFDSCGKGLVKMYLKAQKGEIDSWAVRFAYWHYKNKLSCYHPDKYNSLVKHIGKNGTNVRWYSKFGIRPILRKLRRGANEVRLV